MYVQRIYDFFISGLTANPSGTAVRTNEVAYSYANLAVRASRWAAGLRSAGRLRRVAFFLSNPMDAYPAMLAASKLGAAYVPVSTASPPHANAALLAEAQPDLLIADSHTRSVLASLGSAAPSIPALCDVKDLDNNPHDRQSAIQASAEDEAYILFTSGSTGSPKGIPITNGNLDAFYATVRDHYRLEPGDVVSQLHELTFDSSVVEIVLGWAAGATIDVPTKGDLLTFERYLRAQRPTFLLITPSFAEAVLRTRSVTEADLISLRYVLFGGEPLGAKLAMEWRNLLPAAAIDNFYGPTEVTIACASWRWRPGSGLPPLPSGRVPIGSVYPGLDFLLLDEDGNATSRYGELCLRGAQVMRGYLAASDDESAFVTLLGRRWYRTGDQVELHPEYGLLYRGRMDSQVKIRGYRVDPAATEHALRTIPAVKQAVVLVRHGDTGPQLLGFVTGRISPSAVRRILAEKIPSYMVPSRIAVLSEMPLNTNQKFDAAAALACLD